MRRALLAAALLFCALPAASALTLDELTMQPPCAALESGVRATDPAMAEREVIARYACRLPLALDAAQAQAALGGQDFIGVRDRGALVVIARATESDDPLMLAGSLRGALERIGRTPFAAARFRLADLDRALLDVYLPNTAGAALELARPASAASAGFQARIERTHHRTDTS